MNNKIDSYEGFDISYIETSKTRQVFTVLMVINGEIPILYYKKNITITNNIIVDLNTYFNIPIYIKNNNNDLKYLIKKYVENQLNTNLLLNNIFYNCCISNKKQKLNNILFVLDKRINKNKYPFYYTNGKKIKKHIFIFWFFYIKFIGLYK